MYLDFKTLRYLYLKTKQIYWGRSTFCSVDVKCSSWEHWWTFIYKSAFLPAHTEEEFRELKLKPVQHVGEKRGIPVSPQQNLKAHDEQQERSVLTVMSVSPSLLSCKTELCESPQSFQAAIKHKQTNQWALRSVQVNASFSITSFGFSEMILSKVSPMGIQRRSVWGERVCVPGGLSCTDWLRSVIEESDEPTNTVMGKFLNCLCRLREREREGGEVKQRVGGDGWGVLTKTLSI